MSTAKFIRHCRHCHPRSWWILLFCLIGGQAARAQPKTVTASEFEKNWQGKQISLKTLRNRQGMSVAVTNYGARLVQVLVADKQGRPVDIVIGFSTIDDYIRANGRNYGAIVGRYANRMAGASFRLNGRRYQLPKNNNGNNIHGGPDGFNDRVWDWGIQTDTSLQLSYLSRDGENGFPGNLKVVLTYCLNEANELRLDFQATTDRPTVLNLTNHSYFNLEGGGSIQDYWFSVNADAFTPVDQWMIPTGKIQPVANRPFDLRRPVRIASVWDRPDPQLKLAQGFDHNFVLKKRKGVKGPQPAATAYSPASGILMEVATTEPGLQFFTANTLKGNDTARNGHAIGAREAFCLETQHFPDSPNQPGFPSTELKPGEKYHSVTIYRIRAAEPSEAH